MNNNSISHIFFDLDHTLWDFERNSALTFEKIFKLHNLDVNLPQFLELYVPLNFHYWKLYREDRIDKASLRFARLNDTFNLMKYEVSTSVIYRLSEDYIRYLSTFNHLFEGAVEILEYLHTKYELHIITNGFKDVQQGKLDNSRINKYFITVTNSEVVGAKKPNPKIFRHALNKANAGPENSIMIGDNYEADILGAMNIGIDAIYFNSNGQSAGGEVKQINNLMQIKQYL
jgi:putative hydrolase of the HAD superfamily